MVTPREARDERPGEVGDFLWYSRLCVWAGCGVLLIQAVTGRSSGPVTTGAVVILVGGFLAFLGSLCLEGRSLSWLGWLAETPASEGLPIPDDPGSDRVASVAAHRELLPAAPERIDRAVPPGQGSTLSPALDRAGRVETEVVDASSPLHGRLCVRCGKDIAPGQVAAVCPVCSSPHHAACWIDNRFQCSTATCRGQGSLEAPRPS